MRVRVLFFGNLKEIAGRSDDLLELPEGATLADLLSYCENRFPKLHNFLPSIAVSVNQEYASPAVSLHEQDEIALLPPVSGGSDPLRNVAVNVSIVRAKIDTHKILEDIKAPEDGAVVVFEGIVRDNTRGRRTLYLDYEAYEPMALKQMESVAEQALEQFEIREVSLVHRLGRLEHCETSVLIVVASAHRAAAFESCRWLIDTLKRTVPIWKKEYFEDGAVWADGEPFPPEIAIAGDAHPVAPRSNPRASK